MSGRAKSNARSGASEEWRAREDRSVCRSDRWSVARRVFVVRVFRKPTSGRFYNSDRCRTDRWSVVEKSDRCRTDRWSVLGSGFVEINPPRVGPVFGTSDQAGAHGVFTHIEPFLGVAFRRAQQVVEKSVLPKRRMHCKWRQQRFGAPLFPALKEGGKRFRSHGGAAEKMHMIGHDDVATDPPTVALLGREPFGTQNLMRVIGRQHATALMCAGRDEINRSLEPDPRKPAQGCRASVGIGCGRRHGDSGEGKPDRRSGLQVAQL